MDNNTFYLKLLHNRYADIALGSSILIIIGCIVGVIGNAAIIFLYLFRIKERGERYFIPLLAVVDLLGCLTSPPYYIMDNEYLYNYPSFITCRVLSFLQICIPAISGHTLLLISLQRYMLVCRPFGPKMTLYWKRISFGIVCLISFVYSAPLLATAGVYEDTILFMNKNVTTEVCKFFSGPSLSATVYNTLLFVFMVVNIVLTAGFYIPVLVRIAVSLDFSANRYEVHRDSHDYSHAESSQATCTSEVVENGRHDQEQTKSSYQMQVLETNKNASNSTKKVRFVTSKQSTATSENTSRDPSKPTSEHTETNLKTNTERHFQSKTTHAQRRITIMFFVLVVTYVLSYMPALVFQVLFHTLDDFKFETMTRAETAVWFYMARLVFFNHIVNPLVYGCFDNKFRKQLSQICIRRK